MPPNQKTKLKATKKEWGRALKNVPRALKILWEADKLSTLGLAIVTLFQAVSGTCAAYLGSKIVDLVVGKASFNEVQPWLIAEGALILMIMVMHQAYSLIEEILDHRLGYVINRKILIKAQDLSLLQFENAQFYDRLTQARRQSEFRAIGVVMGIFGFFQNSIALVGMALVLASQKAVVALLLVLGGIPAFVAQVRRSHLKFRLQEWKTPETREMVYLEQVLTLDTAAKEVKLFEIAPFLLKKHEQIFSRVFFEDLKLAKKTSLASLFFGSITTVSYMLAYIWMIVRALNGEWTLGQMTLGVAILRQTQGAITGWMDQVHRIYENSLFLENLFALLDLKAPLRQKQLSAQSEESGLVVERLGFSYPDQAHPALTQVSFKIKVGEKVAFVGANGAGKTTLIKLLLGFYEPTEGSVRWNGAPLKMKDVSVLFQDFVHYQLRVFENMGIGDVDWLEQNPKGSEVQREGSKIERAMERSGIRAWVDSQEQGLDARLGHWFEDGVEVSGGQWQKIGLSRAYMREQKAKLWILDEPTSSLDAESEAQVLDPWWENAAFKDETLILISHRFNNVRRADRIFVLDEGRLLEEGTHESLMKQSGKYATWFELQAKGFR